MKFPKGQTVIFEPTDKGRARAARLVADHPDEAELEPRSPHRVKLLEDFELKPAPRKMKGVIS